MNFYFWLLAIIFACGGGLAAALSFITCSILFDIIVIGAVVFYCLVIESWMTFKKMER